MITQSTYGKAMSVYLNPKYIIITAMKIKQLHSRLLLRLSKFDRPVVVNLKPFFFLVFIPLLFALETIGVSSII